MKRNYLLIVIMLFTSYFFVGCEKNKNPTPEENGTEIVIDASNTEQWVYFSFEEGAVVEIDDPQNSQEWDLAFQKYNIKTNSGVSGQGDGGAVETEELNFNDLTEAPANGYETDEDSISSTLIGYTTEEPIMPIFRYDSGNPVLENWQTQDLTTQPPQVIVNNHVFVVKTAAGNYAKVKFKDYYLKDENGDYVYVDNPMVQEQIKISGHIEFVYTYQANGSNTF